MTQDEFDSICPGDVLLTKDLKDVITPWKGSRKVLVTRYVTSDRIFVLDQDPPTGCGEDIPSGRPFAGRSEVEFYKSEIDKVLTRGTEYYRRQKS